MICIITDASGKVVRTEERELECSIDFCEECGVCLHCFRDKPCYGPGEHRWVCIDQANTNAEETR
jgi:hypothetical protein